MQISEYIVSASKDDTGAISAMRVLTLLGGLMTIATSNIVALTLLWRNEWQDIPHGVSLLLASMLSMLLGAKVWQTKLEKP